MLQLTRLLPTAVLFASLLPPAVAEEVPAADREAIVAEYMSRFRFRPALLTDEAVASVVAVPVYRVEVVFADPAGFDQTRTFTYAKGAKGMVLLARPTQKQRMKDLQSLLKEDFRLQSDDDAKRFQAVLDALYPANEFGEEEDARAIRQTDRGWQFVREAFFDDKAGFVVSTSADGSVKQIAYLLKLPE